MGIWFFTRIITADSNPFFVNNHLHKSLVFYRHSVDKSFTCKEMAI